ncbi:unnamed protein product [Eruca vesicaria subsp. sativa]|uniref:F-box domain-containing protein n=1 Tax=Eruca vesicaria subsp. sativa TaxID=29727 RepID=A0ABC8J439_ERUVS|nr:unnamed protein product [Eruca vesicaria subsp. sativa]
MNPFDLIIEILTRLPPKSLMKFKSVSSIWSSFICSKYFINRYLKASSSSPRLYMWLCFDNKKKLLLSSSSSPDLDVSTMSSFVVDQDLTIPAIEGYSVSHVCRGLMCFTNGTNAQIYNTTTRQLVVLPDIEESNIIAKDHKIRYHIGHDPVHDQYKVVCVVSDAKPVQLLVENSVFVLGGGVSSQWRKTSSSCPPHLPLRQRLTINGRMYYLAWKTSSYSVLVSFDISSEETRWLQKPEDVSWHRYHILEK